MKKLSLAATIWEEEGVYVAKSPETGVASCGDTPEEALCNLLEAVELHLENAKELGMLEDLNAVKNSWLNFYPPFFFCNTRISSISVSG